MGKLIYLMNVSLDGYVETADHSLDWSVVDEETHNWFAERQRSLSAEFYGRRLYELMNGYWPNAAADPDATPATLAYAAAWAKTTKIVFSSTLRSVEGNARLATGTPEAELARARAEFDGDFGVAGPTTAAEFIRRGLVDEFGLVIHPAVLGAGTPYFPSDVRLRLRLADMERLASGLVALTYVPAG